MSTQLICSHLKKVPCFISRNTDELLFERCEAGVKSSAGFGEDVLLTCSASRSLSMQAAKVCERVRIEFACRPDLDRAATSFSDATNFDTCLHFLTLRRKWMDANLHSSGRQRDVQLRTVFHGTSSKNLDPIIDMNLVFPDGQKVRVQNGEAFGKGIYVSERPEVPFSYSAGGPLLACLAMVGESTQKSLRGSPIFVLQETNSQVSTQCASVTLMCYTPTHSTRKTYSCAFKLKEQVAVIWLTSYVPKV